MNKTKIIDELQKTVNDMCDCGCDCFLGSSKGDSVADHLNNILKEIGINDVKVKHHGSMYGYPGSFVLVSKPKKIVTVKHQKYRKKIMTVKQHNQKYCRKT